MTPTEQAWAIYGAWCEAHVSRCHDCEHDAITMTFLYAEYCEGERAATAAALEQAAQIAESFDWLNAQEGLAAAIRSRAGEAK